MAQTLRPFQNEAKAAMIQAQERGICRALCCVFTGGGKTTIFADYIKDQIAKGRVGLVIADQKEIVLQSHERIRDHNNLSMWEIGVEMAASTAPIGAKVVVGSMQTVRNPERLKGWEFDYIIVDEAHMAAAPSYKLIFDRFGAGDRCFLAGFTATPDRFDKKMLFYKDVEGKVHSVKNPKTRKVMEAKPEDSVFEQMVYQKTLLDGVREGWSVPYIPQMFDEEADLSGVETSTKDNGETDFVGTQLKKALEGDDEIVAKRCKRAFKDWSSICPDRPTIVFTPGVETAHKCAAYWRSQGYTAEAVDGETESMDRSRIIAEFKSGRLQVICNYGILTKGTDLPNCSCIINLRPTQSWSLYWQMTGRAGRPLPGTLEGLNDVSPEVRRQVIAASAKPNAIIIDYVSKEVPSCSLPLGAKLPSTMVQEMRGKDVFEVREMFEKLEKEPRIFGEFPETLEELHGTLRRVELLDESKAESEHAWDVTKDGFRLRTTPPGYQAQLFTEEGEEGYTLVVKHATGEVMRKKGKPGHDLRDYLDKAHEHATNKIDQHRQQSPKGTIKRLREMGTGGYYRSLKANGLSDREIDCMPLTEAVNKAKNFIVAWRIRQQKTQQDTSAA